MKNALLLVLLYLPALAFGQDCSDKIKYAQASKEKGDFRKALTQLSAAASSCGEDRKADIEREILDIYDRIDKLRIDAENAKRIAATEAENAKVAEKKAAEALAEAQEAERRTQIALDSLNTVLENLRKANADKVRLILAEVERNQREAKFSAAIDKIKTAELLSALPDSVDKAYKNLTLALLNHARADLRQKAYKPAIAKIENARNLNMLLDSVEVVYLELRQFLLEHIQQDIQNADYDTALVKVNTLNSLQVPRDTIERLWFEIAFCFSETGRTDLASILLDTIAQQRNNMQVRSLLHGLALKEPAQPVQLLRQARNQLDTQQNANLQARYFPPTLGQIPSGTLSISNVAGDMGSGTCTVAINSFAIGLKEVTFYEYDLFCVATNRAKPSDRGWGRGLRPVINVSWYNAVEYCNWRSRQEGLEEVYLIEKESDSDIKVICRWLATGYRLPTEAEWEFAAGNGQKQTLYSWGNNFPSDRNGGNVADEIYKTSFPTQEIFEGYSDGFDFTAPTGNYPPNEFGLYDMSGNVREWCWDWYDEKYCRSSKNGTRPHGPISGTKRTLRGGFWGSRPSECTSSNRYYDNPNIQNVTIGFRLARN